MAQIRLKARITYQGRSVDAIALHDTGAETYAFLDTSIAQKLGLPRGEPIGYAGIAGSSVGFKSQVDTVSIVENPQCALSKVPVVVGSVSVPNVELLVGEYFMRSTQMETKFSADGKVLISCKGGPSIAASQPIPLEYLIMGGAAIAGILALGFFVLKD